MAYDKPYMDYSYGGREEVYYGPTIPSRDTREEEEEEVKRLAEEMYRKSLTPSDRYDYDVKRGKLAREKAEMVVAGGKNSSSKVKPEPKPNSRPNIDKKSLKPDPPSPDPKKKKEREEEQSKTPKPLEEGGWIEVDGRRTYISGASDKAKMNGMLQAKKANIEFEKHQNEMAMNILQMQQQEASEAHMEKMQQKMMDFQADPSQMNLMKMKLEDEYGIERAQIDAVEREIKQAEAKRMEFDQATGAIELDQIKNQSATLTKAALEVLDFKRKLSADEADKKGKEDKLNFEKAKTGLANSVAEKEKEVKQRASTRKFITERRDKIFSDTDVSVQRIYVDDGSGGQKQIAVDMNVKQMLGDPDIRIQKAGMKAFSRAIAEFADSAGASFRQATSTDAWSAEHPALGESPKAAFETAMREGKHDRAMAIIGTIPMNEYEYLRDYPDIVEAIYINELNKIGSKEGMERTKTFGDKLLGE